MTLLFHAAWHKHFVELEPLSEVLRFLDKAEAFSTAKLELAVVEVVGLGCCIDYSCA